MEPLEIKALISKNTHLGLSLSSNISYLLDLLSSDEIDYRGAAQAISKYPNIAARLIFLANSAWASRTNKAKSLEMACARLGLPMVKSVSIALCTASCFQTNRCQAFDRERFWNSSLVVADGAAMIASNIPDFSDQEVKIIHSAGLLHILGLLWLADHIPEETSEALAASASMDSISTRDALSSIVGIDYCDVGKMLGAAWALPEVIVSVLEHHRDTDYDGADTKYVAIVGYAAQIVSKLYSGKSEYPNVPSQIRIGSDKLAEIVCELSNRLNDNRNMMNLIFAKS